MATARLKRSRSWQAALVVPGLALALDARPPVPATTGAGLSDDGGEWIVAPGESPLSLARLLFPESRPSSVASFVAWLSAIPSWRSTPTAGTRSGQGRRCARRTGARPASRNPAAVHRPVADSLSRRPHRRKPYRGSRTAEAAREAKLPAAHRCRRWPLRCLGRRHGRALSLARRLPERTAELGYWPGR